MMTADIALTQLETRQKTHPAYTIKAVAFNIILNEFIGEVRRVSIMDYTIDFKDGSLISFRDGSHSTHGFYALTQKCRA